MTEKRTATPGAWRPGVSGNPGGRPKRKPLTTMALHYLQSAVKRGGTQTHREKLIVRLFEIIYEAEPKESLKAIDMLWKYLEGTPQQTAELQAEDAMRDIARRTGAPIAFIRDRARLLAARLAIEGDVIDGVSEPVEQTVTRVESVKRVR